ncbi:hypothetical protein IFM12275_50440 [Nocardia sputorum]|uniref:hypothetical protein n=1 Tax=Nocardia sputorum TaxID=2984338 RepID=UPI0024927385|nr:hypothetical protein [Nocardia sputorum]BDT95068.1 hypothetical protein IFM12275_50440 [Nocardia sputorum]
MLGFVVAVGLPLAVLAWAIAWPESTARQAEAEREFHGGNGCRFGAAHEMGDHNF